MPKDKATEASDKATGKDLEGNVLVNTYSNAQSFSFDNCQAVDSQNQAREGSLLIDHIELEKKKRDVLR